MEHQRATMHNNDSFSMSEHYQKGPSAFCTPSSPPQSNSYATFAWPFPTSQNQRVLFISDSFSRNISFFQ